MSVRALQLDGTLRYDSYDTINIIQQYRDIVFGGLSSYGVFNPQALGGEV